MAIPKLTAEERAQALEKAKAARAKRAQIREDLKGGKLSVKQVLDMRGDDVVGRMKVSTFIETLPGYGKAKAEEGGFLEWARYAGHGYGTPRRSVEEHVAAGEQVVLEIDMQGAFQVREKMPSAKLVFVEPPSMEELERRLRKRGTEDEGAIAKRMAAAEVELSRKMEYDKQLVNDDLDEAVAELVAYVNEQAQS